MRLFRSFVFALLFASACGAEDSKGIDPKSRATGVVDARSLRGKVLCGYQGWFRCPGDGAKEGWIHWSRDSQRVAPETLTFEMWPDMTEYGAEERFAAPGFTSANGNPSCLFSSAQPATVQRHFAWMRNYGIDGIWLQHFLVDLPGGPLNERYASRRGVLGSVRTAAQQTGRTWAIAFDIAGMPTGKIFEVLVTEWKKLVDEGVTEDGRYLHYVPLANLVEYLSSKPSIGDELDRLRTQLRAGEMERSIWMVHQPPTGLGMDVITDGRQVGSPTILKFINDNQPLLGCSGHIHESPYQPGGKWMARVGKTVWVQPGQMEHRLHYVSLEIGAQFMVTNVQHSIFGRTIPDGDRIVGPRQHHGKAPAIPPRRASRELPLKLRPLAAQIKSRVCWSPISSNAKASNIDWRASTATLACPCASDP